MNSGSCVPHGLSRLKGGRAKRRGSPCRMDSSKKKAAKPVAECKPCLIYTPNTK